MAHPAQRQSSPADANRARQTGLPSRDACLERRSSWSRPFRRLRRAIDFSERSIQASCRVLLATERLAPGAPVPTSRQLCRAAGRLTEAAVALTRAALGLQVPDTPEAADPLIGVALVWIETAGKMTGLAERLHTHVLTTRPPVTVAVPITPRPLLRPRQIRICDGLSFASLRRSRPRVTTSANAPRQISRGRAPPLASSCSFSSPQFQSEEKENTHGQSGQ